MQYALIHKWLERLTHTNIHISPEEEIPQGWDRAICVWQTEHRENRPQHKKNPFKGRTMLQLPRGWQRLGEASHDLSHTFIFLLVWELLDTQWCFSNRYKLVKCHVHTRVSEMLSWSGQWHRTRKSCGKRKPGGSSFHHWPPTTASSHDRHHFIHESNKADSGF